MSTVSRYFSPWCSLALLGLWLSGCASPVEKWNSLTRQIKGNQLQTAAYREQVESQEIPRKVKDPVKLKLSYAQWMEEMGRLPEASAHYNEVLKDDPKCIDALLGSARMHERAGQMQTAEEQIQQALKIEPSSPDARHALGRCYAAQKRFSEAINQFRQSTAAAPTNAQCHYDLAVALAQTGQTSEALASFNRCLEPAASHFNLGIIFKEQGQLPQAAEQFQQALGIDPNLAQARVMAEQVRRQSEGAAAVANASGLPAGHDLPQGPTNTGIQRAAHHTVKIVPGEAEPLTR